MEKLNAADACILTTATHVDAKWQNLRPKDLIKRKNIDE